MGMTTERNKIKKVDCESSKQRYEIYLELVFLQTFLTWLDDVSQISGEKETFSTIIDFIVSKKLLAINHITNLLKYNRATINRWRNGENYPNSFVRDNIILALKKELISEFQKNVILYEKENIEIAI